MSNNHRKHEEFLNHEELLGLSIYIYIVILFYRNASFVIPFYKLILQSELKGVPILDTNSNDTVVLC